MQYKILYILWATSCMQVYKHDPHYHVIDNFTWRHIRNTCPKLRVSMYFESIGKYEDISRVLSRDIPLRCLQVHT